MNEAMRCDRISLMHAGTVLACDAPTALVAARGGTAWRRRSSATSRTPSGDAAKGDRDGGRDGPIRRAGPINARRREHSVRRSRFAARPAAGLQPPRDAGDSARSGAAGVRVRRVAVLMLVFGFGITTDVEHIRYRGPGSGPEPGEPRLTSTSSRAPRTSAGSDRFERQREEEQRLQANDISLSIEIPTGLRPRFLRETRAPRSRRWSTAPTRSAAETIKQYITGVNQRLRHPAIPNDPDAAARCRTEAGSSRATSTTRRSRASTRSCRASRRSS